MPKDIYDKLKVIPELIKAYYPVLIMFGGLGTGGYQWWDKTEVVEKAVVEKNQAVHEVAVAFQSMTVEKAPAVVDTCPAVCLKRIEKLEGWH